MNKLVLVNSITIGSPCSEGSRELSVCRDACVSVMCIHVVQLMRCSRQRPSRIISPSRSEERVSYISSLKTNILCKHYKGGASAASARSFRVGGGDRGSVGQGDGGGSSGSARRVRRAGRLRCAGTTGSMAGRLVGTLGPKTGLGGSMTAPLEDGQYVAAFPPSPLPLPLSIPCAQV